MYFHDSGSSLSLSGPAYIIVLSSVDGVSSLLWLALDGDRGFLLVRILKGSVWLPGPFLLLVLHLVVRASCFWQPCVAQLCGWLVPCF